MLFIILLLKTICIVVVQAGIIIGVLYLLYRFRWKKWIHDGLVRAGEDEAAKKYE